MKPWERQENESSPAFEAFVLYRDTRPRSLRKVSEVLDKSKSLVEGWSSSHHWVMRCEQWDNELDAVSQQSQIDEVTEMKRRQIGIAIHMQELAAKALKLLEASLESKNGKSVISADNSVRMADIGAKLERLNRDEPSNIERVQKNDFSKLNTEELFTLRALLQKSGNVD
jgi:hypothetical protein